MNGATGARCKRTRAVIGLSKIAGIGSETLMLVMLSVAVPVLVRVTVCEVLVVPTD